MQIIHHITLDMVKPTSEVPLDAVQGDGNTRLLRLTLLENGENWAAPADVTAAVAFRKADGTKGLYDTLPDGAKAVTVDGNAVTAVLARQALSCPGDVSAAVVFHDSNLNQLATFPFTIRVKANPAAGKQVSNDYYQYSTMEEVSAAVEAALAALEDGKQDFLVKAEEALQVVHDTAAENAPAIIREASGESITVSDAADRPLKGLSIYGKTTQNGTPTPENPVELVSVGASGAINTTVCGKNLLPNNANTATISGITFTVNADGSVTANGTATAYAMLKLGEVTLPAGIYILSGAEAVGKNESQSSYIRIVLIANDAGIGDTFGQERVITIAETTTVSARIDITAGTTVKGTFHPMIRLASDTDSNYEPYKGQALTASTPNGLPGIPVSGGGNYTDKNGQAWVCDEIDFARSVRVQRVVQVDMGNLDWAYSDNRFVAFPSDIVEERYADGYCTHYLVVKQNFSNLPDKTMTVNDSMMSGQRCFVVRDDSVTDGDRFREHVVGAKVMCKLATPIETPLSAEELAQYAVLHTNKPNTTVFNDSGAGMELSYVADTKTYIDNKLAAISAAMLNA